MAATVTPQLINNSASTMPTAAVELNQENQSVTIDGKQYGLKDIKYNASKDENINIITFTATNVEDDISIKVVLQAIGAAVTNGDYAADAGLNQYSVIFSLKIKGNSYISDAGVINYDFNNKKQHLTASELSLKLLLESSKKVKLALDLTYKS